MEENTKAELSAEDIEKLKAENETLKAENKALKAQVEGLGDVIKELNEDLASKDSEIKSISKKAVIKHGKDSYEMTLKKFVYKYKGNIITVDEELLNSDKELVAELIKADKGVLIKKGGK